MFGKQIIIVSADDEPKDKLLAGGLFSCRENAGSVRYIDKCHSFQLSIFSRTATQHFQTTWLCKVPHII